MHLMAVVLLAVKRGLCRDTWVIFRRCL